VIKDTIKAIPDPSEYTITDCNHVSLAVEMWSKRKLTPKGVNENFFKELVSYIVRHGLAIVKLDTGEVYGGNAGTITILDIKRFLIAIKKSFIPKELEVQSEPSSIEETQQEADTARPAKSEPTVILERKKRGPLIISGNKKNTRFLGREVSGLKEFVEILPFGPMISAAKRRIRETIELIPEY